MTSARRIVTPALLGAWATLLAWVATKWDVGLGHGLARLRFVFDLVGEDEFRYLVLGGLVGLGQVLAALRNTPRLRAEFRPAQMAWGLAAGIASGLISHFVERFSAPHWPIWAGIGAAAGAIDGFVSGSRRSALSGFLGGSLCGAIGGLLVGLMSPGDDFRHWVAASALSAASWVVAGAMIGGGAALARLATYPASIKVIKGPRTGMDIPMDRRIFAIGSHPKNDLQLNSYDGKTSEFYHARIRRGSGIFRIENTCPSPTYVGRERVQVRGPHPLSHDERISIAGQTLRFRLHPLLRGGSVGPSQVTVTFSPRAKEQETRSDVSTAKVQTAPASGLSGLSRRVVSAWVAGPDKLDEPNGGPPKTPLGLEYIPVPSEAEVEKECVAPCPSCGRRYFGGPDGRYCDHCRSWF